MNMKSFFQDHTLPLKRDETIFVGLSGGVDSMVLLHKLHHDPFLGQHPIKMHAMIMDHGLRRQSKLEALALARYCEQHHIPHHIIDLSHNDFSRQLQKQARQARYGFFQKIMHAYGARYVCVGHHLLDQIESFLLRRTHTDHPQSLSGIHPVHHHHGITILRPMHDMQKKDIYDYAEHHNLCWLNDQSNEHGHYHRTQLRQSLYLRPAEQNRIYTTLLNNRHTTQKLKKITADFIERYVVFSNQGFASLDALSFTSQATEQAPIIAEAITTIVGQITGRMPQAKQSEKRHLLQKLKSLKNHNYHNFMGCIFIRYDNMIHIFRDPQNILEKRIYKMDPIWFDHRFYIKMEHAKKEAKKDAKTGIQPPPKTNQNAQKNVPYFIIRKKDQKYHLPSLIQAQKWDDIARLSMPVLYVIDHQMDHQNALRSKSAQSLGKKGKKGKNIVEKKIELAYDNNLGVTCYFCPLWRPHKKRRMHD